MKLTTIRIKTVGPDLFQFMACVESETEFDALTLVSVSGGSFRNGTEDSWVTALVLGRSTVSDGVFSGGHSKRVF
jgi:hypothetical protein